ncbi:MAG: hypothetical protein VB051_09325 [Candidatus Pelethousia sp.]|nr:hypothetical protein [Candidatus Pelethousia sp.]
MDRMDELLDVIGAEANEKIDFEAALFEVLAKAQAKEQERSQQAARKKPRMQVRYLSMAAGVILLVGAAVLLNRSGLMRGAGSATPESAQPQLAMSAADADTAAGAAEAAPEAPAAAAAPAAPAPAAFAAPAEDGGGMTGQSRIMAQPFYGSAAITVPAAGSACTQGSAKNGADSTPLPEEALRNGSHDAYDAEGGICRIGETARLTAQEKLAALGYAACFSTDAHVDQLAALLPGEACIANAGEIAVWNTGDGFLTLWDPTLSQMELYDLLMQAV